MLMQFKVEYKMDPANLESEKVLEDTVYVNAEKNVDFEKGYRSIIYAFKEKKGITNCCIVAIYMCEYPYECIYDNPANSTPSKKRKE